ncbi:AraC family transcriptional regulator [Sciscionella marina]|uniref:AraC family transcriptional regulator n=1 Tax=Sciscionella marina TaxID=508770 RepID=UPI000381A5C2|nr:AraC family transcriptional regulator [Sciscionella marina]
MTAKLLRFAEHAVGEPYHADLVTQPVAAGVSETHGHADFFEFMSIIEGNGLHHLDSGAQQLRAGDVTFVRPRDVHAMQGLAPRGMRFVNIAFPAAAWHGFVDIARIGTWEDATAAPLWRLSGSAVRRAREVFGRALERFHAHPTMLDMMRFWTDLVELLQQQPGSGARPGTRPPAWLARVLEQMHAEPQLRGGVPLMARLAAVSPAHLSRTMRAHYGTTPTEFITGLRLERAAQLLGSTDEPVTQIAYRCGFASQSYFTRRFGTAYGLSPTAYRRRTWQSFVPG